MEKKSNFYFLIPLFALQLCTFFLPQSSFGFGQDNPDTVEIETTCYELGTCNFFEEPFNTLILPYSEVFGAFIFLLVWALIIGILWLRLGNTMVVGIIGLALAAMFNSPLDLDQDGQADLTPFAGDAQLIGYVLLCVAITVVIYQILAVRTRYPSN